MAGSEQGRTTLRALIGFTGLLPISLPPSFLLLSPSLLFPFNFLPFSSPPHPLSPLSSRSLKYSMGRAEASPAGSGSESEPWGKSRAEIEFNAI